MPRKSDGCPVCKKTAAAAFSPFCSQLCRDRDLLAWLDGRYRIPVPPDEEPAAGD